MSRAGIYPHCIFMRNVTMKYRNTENKIVVVSLCIGNLYHAGLREPLQKDPIELSWIKDPILSDSHTPHCRASGPSPMNASGLTATFPHRTPTSTLLSSASNLVQRSPCYLNAITIWHLILTI